MGKVLFVLCGKPRSGVAEKLMGIGDVEILDTNNDTIAVDVGSHEKVVVMNTCDVTMDLINKILRDLETSDVVYVGSRPRRLTSRIAKTALSAIGFQRAISENLTSCIVGVRTDALTTKNIRIHSPLILPSIWIHLDKQRELSIKEIEHRGLEPAIEQNIGRAAWRLSLEGGYVTRILKFMAAGAATLALNMFLLFFLTDIIGIPYYFSAVIAIEGAILFSFQINEEFVFRKHVRRHRRARLMRLLSYNIASWSTGFLGLIILIILTEYGHIYYLLSNFLSFIVTSVLMFLLCFQQIWQ